MSTNLLSRTLTLHVHMLVYYSPILHSFTGYGYTAGETADDDDFYGHTVEDRLEFIVGALNQIGVER